MIATIVIDLSLLVVATALFVSFAAARYLLLSFSNTTPRPLPLALVKAYAVLAASILVGLVATNHFTFHFGTVYVR